MRLAPAVTLALFVPLRLGAAESGGALSGVVTTQDGSSLAQVTLVVNGPNVRRTIVTGPGGRYRADDLPAGEYTVASGLPGFLLSPDTPLRVEGEARLDLTLLPAPVREQVVVSATRGEAAASTLGISVTVLDGERLRAAEPADLLHVLDEAPGVSVARVGGVGLQASAFVRGGESRFARVLVDGMPVNESGGAYNFGTTLPLELERVEVVRGAASSLYGTDALAGVIHLVTRRAAPGSPPALNAEAEAGSFDWQRFLGRTSGRAGRFDWNLGGQWMQTDNGQPNSDFSQAAAAASLGGAWGDTSARLALRFEDGEAGTPGPTAYGRPDLDARYERRALVLSGTLRHTTGRLAHELLTGVTDIDDLSVNPLDSGDWLPAAGARVGAFPLSDFVNAEGFQNDIRRLLASYRLEAQAGARHLLSGGVELERETGELGSRPDGLISPERTNVGVWLQDQVVLGERAFLTAGGRLEDNDSYGTKVVPRVALAVRLRGGDDATLLKASGGAGIKEPSFFESFGTSFFARGNPDLKPERSETYDVGIEQRLFGGRLRVDAIAFHHDYRDQIAFTTIDFNTFAGTYVNLGHTRARGLELALEAAPTPALRVLAEYTYLDTEVLTASFDFDPVYAAGRPLLRRPKHQGSLSARYEHGRFDLGATVLAVGRRADSDFVGLGFLENEGYARLDGRIRVRVGRGFTAYLAGENLLDRQYEEVLGYPALGRSIRAGLRYRGGERRP